MPLFLRKIKHSLLFTLVKVLAAFSAGARHNAFAGSGSAAQLCRHIVDTGFRKVLVVTDKPLRELGVVDKAVAILSESGCKVSFFDGVLPDPTYDQVAAGVAVVKANGNDAILAVGGGSSIDAAKIIAASATSDESPQDWEGFGKVKHDAMKLFAIPTTAGTGSEATIGAVISDAQTHQKAVISGASLLPDAVALDPDLLLGLPPAITAATGMDALTHAIEAYIGTWERGSRLEDARIAVKLVFEHLPTAYRDGSNRDARAGMSMAAYYGGLAINQVNVGNVHAIAHQLGSKYGIPHGLANALVLPHVLEFCLEEAAPRLAELARLIGVGEAERSDEQLAHHFVAAVKDLRTQIGIADRSEKLQTDDFSEIAKLAIEEGDGYPVPRLLDKKNVLAILGRIAC
ncbi:MAG: iron-containing alcohol dehydrogenase [Pseudomonadota bacterium]